MDFARNLKQLRSKLGLTQQELADRLGVGQATIASYEAGTRHPKLNQVEHIAEVLKASIKDLLK